MKPTLEISPALIDNRDRFDGPFFERYQLRPAPQPLQLDAAVAKHYQFPTLYGEVTCAQAIFHCDYQRARELMPHPDLRPIRMLRGRALLALSCYIYREVHQVGPYNEIAMTIPVVAGGGWAPPVLPMVAPRWPGAGFYVFDMPVTSLENQIRGTRIWGLPKVVREIAIETRGGVCRTTAFEEDGRRALELAVPTTGRETPFDVRASIYSVLDGDRLDSPTAFHGRFAVRKNPATLLRRGVAAEAPTLTLGEGPAAERLRRLEVEPTPLETRFAERMQSSFDLPSSEPA